MNAAQTYFYRNQGEWDWTARFKVTSWYRFLKAPLSFFNKLRFAIMIGVQFITGPFEMHTRVQLMDSNTISHMTQISMLGITAARSFKTFTIQKDGHSLALKGEETFWPFLSSKSAFRPMHGRILESTSSAEYEMPFLGSHCDCKTNLVANVGEIIVETPWMKGAFKLDEASQRVLTERFKA